MDNTDKVSNEELSAQVEALAEQVANLTEENAKLSAQVNKVETSVKLGGKEEVKPLPEPETFKLNGKNVRFKYRRINVDGNEILVHELDKKRRDEIAVEYPGCIEVID